MAASSSSSVPEQDGDRSRQGRPVRKRHVKRPMNAFMIWGRAERRRLAAENPIASNGDLSRILGHKWNAMRDDEKEPFLAEAERLRKEHRQQYPDYKYRPRPPRKRSAVDGIPGYDQYCNTSSSVDSQSMKLAGTKYSTCGSPQLISVLQQFSVSDLLNAIASKASSTTDQSQHESGAKAGAAHSCDRSGDRKLQVDLENFQLSSPLAEDLADINLSPLIDNNQPNIYGDGPPNPLATDQSNDEWGLSELAASFNSSTQSSAANTPPSGYSQQRAFWTDSGFADQDNQTHSHEQSSAPDAMQQSSLSSAPLAESSSVDMPSGCYWHVPSSSEASATSSPDNRLFTCSGTTSPEYYYPLTGWC